MQGPFEILNHWCERRPQAPALGTRDAAGHWQWWDWRKLRLRAQAQASDFSRAGIAAGHRVLVIDPPPAQLVPGVFGLWTLGAVPLQVARPGAAVLQQSVAELCERWSIDHVLLAAGDAPGLRSPVPLHRLRDAAAPIPAAPPGPAIEAPSAGPVAIQLSSGSLGSPKAIELGSGELMRHLAAMRQALPPAAQPLTVSWLPLYHDMGLVGGLLYTLFVGSPLLLGHPRDFRRRPYDWLRWLHQHRATITVGPPSAYALMLRLASRARRAQLDLSCVKQMAIGAEPIPAQLPASLCAALAPCGLRDTVFVPAYGMAEATLCISMPAPGQRPRVDRIQRSALERDQLAEAGKDLEFLSVGRAIDGVEIRVQGRSGDPLPERRVGEIAFRSASMMRGYLPASAKLRGWFATGDLGYLADGELFITGRVRELIICGGRNFLPAIVEAAADKVLGRPASAAVGVPAMDGGEHLLLFAENRRADDAALNTGLRAALLAQDIPVSRIVLLPPGGLPRTSSGKLRRQELRRRYIAGEFSPQDEAGQQLAAEWLGQAAAAPDPRAPGTTTAALEAYLCRRIDQLAVPLQQSMPSDSPLLLDIDSLAAMNLQAVVESELEIELPLGIFAGDLRISEIAKICLKAARTQVRRSVPTATVPTGCVPLAPLQMRLLAGRDSIPPLVNLLILRTPLGLNPAQLQPVLDWLIRRHPALSLQFRLEAGQWQAQPLDSPAAVPLRPVELLPGSAVPEQSRQASEELATLVDPAAGQHLAATLLSQPDQRPVLLMALHHLCVDAMSVAILLNDLERGYRQLLRDGELPAVQPRTGVQSFSDWSGALQEYAASQTAAGLVGQILARSPPANAERGTAAPLNLPLDGLDTAQTRAFYREFRRAAQRHDIFLALVAQAWSRLHPAEEFCIELEHHGRQIMAGADPTLTVGWLAGRFPLRIQIIGGETPPTTARRLRREIDALPLGGLGLSALEAHAPAGDRLALQQRLRAPVGMVYRGGFSTPHRAGAAFGVLQAGTMGTEYDPAAPVKVVIEPGPTQINWLLSTDTSREKQAQTLAGYLNQGLATFLAESASLGDGSP